MNTVEKKLADLIREHPNLYDQSRRDYKDNMKGHLSWKEIADNMGKSEDEVKLKWKNLRDKFCKAKKRMAKRSFPLLTDDENPVERPVPVLFHQLAWLSAYVKPRPGTGLGETDEVCVHRLVAHRFKRIHGSVVKDASQLTEFSSFKLTWLIIGLWKCSHC